MRDKARIKNSVIYVDDLEKEGRSNVATLADIQRRINFWELKEYSKSITFNWEGNTMNKEHFAIFFGTVNDYILFEKHFEFTKTNYILAKLHVQDMLELAKMLELEKE